MWLKILGLLFFLCTPLIAVDDYNFIFIHVGKNFPACSYTTLKQTRFMNEKSDIYFLLDHSNYIRLIEENEGFFKDNQITLVDLSKVPKTHRHYEFLEISPFDKIFMNGFWNHTTERFFYLHDFLEKIPLKNVIHMETDVMLYVNMQELLPFFLPVQLAGTFQWTTECVPGFIFIQQPQIWDRYIDHIIDELKFYTGKNPNTDLNDMRTLASFKTKCDSEFIHLPIIMPEYELYSEKQAVKEAPRNTTLEFLSKNAYMFPGYLFDAAAFGIYVNGYNKIVYPNGKKGDIHWKSLFDPSKLKFFWGSDERGKNVPYLSFMGSIYRVVNLHFHSKHPEEFTSFMPERKALE